MKLTYNEIGQLLDNLTKLGTLSGTDWATYYAEAKGKLVEELDKLYSKLNALRKTDEFKAYAIEEEKLAKPYVKTKEDEQKELAQEEQDKLILELQALRERPEFKDICDKYQAEGANIQDKLDNQIEVNVKQIDRNVIPAEITAEQAFSIRQLLKGYEADEVGEVEAADLDEVSHSAVI